MVPAENLGIWVMNPTRMFSSHISKMDDFEKLRFVWFSTSQQHNSYIRLTYACVYVCAYVCTHVRILVCILVCTDGWENKCVCLRHPHLCYNIISQVYAINYTLT